jgi:hypothetical protein
MAMDSRKKQTGAMIDGGLYRQVKSLAVLRQRRVGDLIDDAIRAFLAGEMAATASKAALNDKETPHGQPVQK